MYKLYVEPRERLITAPSASVFIFMFPIYIIVHTIRLQQANMVVLETE